MRNRLTPFQGSRLVFFSVIMICTFVVLVIRLYDFQFTHYSEYQAAADENSQQSVPLPAPRGVIYDRNGIKLALNAPAFNVVIVPALLPTDSAASNKVLHQLSALINVPDTRAAADAAGKTKIRSLQEQVDEGAGIAPYRPVVVATDVDQLIAQQIQENNRDLPGVQVQTISVRQYPTGNATAQVVGYLGPIGKAEADKLRATGYNPAFDRVGYAGVESYLDNQLAGQRGLLTQVVDVAGLPIRVVKQVAPQPGANVRLTIDLPLQIAATQFLTDEINDINTKKQSEVSNSGVVIALNPKTGEILAMVSLPTYDNSKFARAIDANYYSTVLQQKQTPLLNHAIGSLYPPGSTWKLLTANAVLQENVIQPGTELNDPGIITVQNKLAANDIASKQDFVCWYRKGHGKVNLIHAIAWSCDVYFYQVGGGNDTVPASQLRPGGLGITDLDRYATMFGIGVDSGVELPGEAGGRMPDPTWKRRNYGESWSTGDTYNAAFGQGYVTLSPLQLVTAEAAIANGGTMFQPTIINSWVDSEGNPIPNQSLQPKVMRTLTTPTAGAPIVLNMREDMYLMGASSLVCTCELDSPYHDPTSQVYDKEGKLPKCSQDFINNYTGKMSVPGKPDQTYKVNVPLNFSFDRSMCDPQRIADNTPYNPPFVDEKNIQLVREGTYEAVRIPGATAVAANIPNREVAGKTGTAEYCDDVARPLGLCQHGAWPSHAWFFGYAPFQNPEIAVVAFVYNAGEGAYHALPVVKAVINCYYMLKDIRNTPGAQPPDATACKDAFVPLFDPAYGQ